MPKRRRHQCRIEHSILTFQSHLHIHIYLISFRRRYTELGMLLFRIVNGRSRKTYCPPVRQFRRERQSAPPPVTSPTIVTVGKSLHYRYEIISALNVSGSSVRQQVFGNVFWKKAPDNKDKVLKGLYAPVLTYGLYSLSDVFH